MQGPQQRNQAHGQQGQAAPAGTAWGRGFCNHQVNAPERSAAIMR
ncbi:hypothetical protein DW66_0269 [Pseudomonas putida]|nr:hypothetical protein DW66_0269 [Pseudomonas putida]